MTSPTEQLVDMEESALIKYSSTNITIIFENVQREDQGEYCLPGIRRRWWSLQYIQHDRQKLVHNLAPIDNVVIIHITILDIRQTESIFLFYEILHFAVYNIFNSKLTDKLNYLTLIWAWAEGQYKYQNRPTQG